MAEIKKYYWLKLSDNFFDDDTIAWIEEQKNGKDYVLFYLKLCLKSLSNDGYLIRYVGQKLIPFDVNSLSSLTNTPHDTVAVAMKLFIEIGLISQLDSGEIYMNQINEMIGSETDSAKRMRKLRAKEQLRIDGPSHCDNNVQNSDADVQKSDTEIEKEIDIDKEKEKKNKSQSPRRYDDDSPYLKMAQYLFNWIKQNNPSAKEPNYQKWADDFRKLSEIDKRSKKDIKQIIDWSQKDNFWQTNILSPAKLRKHFDKLTMQMNAKPSKRNSFQEVEPSWLNQEKTGLQEVKEEKTHNKLTEETEAEFDDIDADIQARLNRLYGDDDN